MADGGLRSMLLAGALLWMGCSRDKPPHHHEQKPTPSPSSTAPAPTPREHRESAEPPVLDPTKRPPTGYRRMAIGGVAPTPEGNAVVLMDLTDEAARRGIVIFVGETKTLAVKKLGADIVGVRVDRVEDDVFYGALLLSKDGRFFELTARPSDAIALALVRGNAVPVFVADAVLSQAGIDVDRFDFRRVREAPKAGTRSDEVEL